MNQVIHELNMGSVSYISNPVILTWPYYWALQQTHSNLTINIIPSFSQWVHQGQNLIGLKAVSLFV